MRGKVISLQHLGEERAEPRSVGRDLRIDVEEQPAASVVERLEVPHVERPALAVQADSRLALRRGAEQLVRPHDPAARVGRADQPLVAHWAAMREAEDRLEVARKAQFLLRSVLAVSGVSLERRSEVHRA